MPIGTLLPPAHLRPLREHELARLGRLLRGERATRSHHEREYNAIRNAAALIDVSPLFKYRVCGKDATRLVDRMVTRDVPKMKVGPGGLHALVRRRRAR